MKPSNYDIEATLALRLKALRIEKGWSLDVLADHSGLSRATLSRIEKNEVSPTTHALHKLCIAFGISVSHLILLAESPSPALINRADQPVWQDKKAGFTRRNVSPPSPDFAGEIIECELKIDAQIHYDMPSKPGLEHHLWLIAGSLAIHHNGSDYQLNKGDCLRYKLMGATTFKVTSDHPAHYILALI